jgi:hypothetical protein
MLSVSGENGTGCIRSTELLASAAVKHGLDLLLLALAFDSIMLGAVAVDGKAVVCGQQRTCQWQG